MSTLTSTTREKEARALKRLFEQRSRLSQAKFGQEYGIGSAGMVWQYLNGHRPLNLPVATKFANGLGVRIDEFSQRLAAEATNAARATTDGAQARESEPPPYDSDDSKAGLEGVVLADVLRYAPKEERHRVLDEIRMLAIRARSRFSPEELARNLDAIDRLDRADQPSTLSPGEEST